MILTVFRFVNIVDFIVASLFNLFFVQTFESARFKSSHCELMTLFFIMVRFDLLCFGISAAERRPLWQKEFQLV